MTIRKWKSRSEFHDRSHTAHRLQTRPTPAQEAIVVSLRRHGVGNLRKLLPTTEKAAPKAFKAYMPGYLHRDVQYLPQMADETGRRYLFVAVDRATRRV